MTADNLLGMLTKSVLQHYLLVFSHSLIIHHLPQPVSLEKNTRKEARNKRLAGSRSIRETDNKLGREYVFPFLVLLRYLGQVVLNFLLREGLEGGVGLAHDTNLNISGLEIRGEHVLEGCDGQLDSLLV